MGRKAGGVAVCTGGGRCDTGGGVDGDGERGAGQCVPVFHWAGAITRIVDDGGGARGGSWQLSPEEKLPALSTLLVVGLLLSDGGLGLGGDWTAHSGAWHCGCRTIRFSWWSPEYVVACAGGGGVAQIPLHFLTRGNCEERLFFHCSCARCRWRVGLFTVIALAACWTLLEGDVGSIDGFGGGGGGDYPCGGF